MFEGGILLGATTDSSGFSATTDSFWPFMQLERTVGDLSAALRAGKRKKMLETLTFALYEHYCGVSKILSCLFLCLKRMLSSYIFQSHVYLHHILRQLLRRK